MILQIWERSGRGQRPARRACRALRRRGSSARRKCLKTSRGWCGYSLRFFWVCESVPTMQMNAKNNTSTIVIYAVSPPVIAHTLPFRVPLSYQPSPQQRYAPARIRQGHPQNRSYTGAFGACGTCEAYSPIRNLCRERRRYFDPCQKIWRFLKELHEKFGWTRRAPSCGRRRPHSPGLIVNQRYSPIVQGIFSWPETRQIRQPAGLTGALAISRISFRRTARAKSAKPFATT